MHELCDELDFSHVINHGEGMDGSKHLYLIRVQGIDVERRNEIIAKMVIRGVTTIVHFKPLPIMTAYKTLRCDITDFPNSYDYYHNPITIPSHFF